jgi:hypothetical protein
MRSWKNWDSVSRPPAELSKLSNDNFDIAISVIGTYHTIKAI